MNGPQRQGRAERFATAPCVDSDVDFVPNSLHSAGPALDLCRTCGLRAECLADLQDALNDDPHIHGVWAGEFVPAPQQHHRKQTLVRLGLTVPRKPAEVTTKRNGCRNGHPESDTIILSGQRRCVACRRISTERRRAERRAERVAS